MPGKTPVNTTKAPKALPGIYNQAIVANGMVFCSGVVALDSDTMKIKEGDVKAHTVCNLLDITPRMLVPDKLTLQIA
jgi:enamine deaminase RidA (YjgF/YER057c/UK114 family)